MVITSVLKDNFQLCLSKSILPLEKGMPAIICTTFGGKEAIQYHVPYSFSRVESGNRFLEEKIELSRELSHCLIDS